VSEPWHGPPVSAAALQVGFSETLAIDVLPECRALPDGNDRRRLYRRVRLSPSPKGVASLLTQSQVSLAPHVPLAQLASRLAWVPPVHGWPDAMAHTPWPLQA
jgi:hypothetical protein